MIPSRSSQIANTFKQRLRPITITNPAWDKFRDILTGVSNAETIKLDTAQIDYCSCIERRYNKTSSNTYQRKISIYKPSLSLVTTEEFNEMHEDDKRYPPTVLVKDDTSVIIPYIKIDILHGINIHYSPTDYFIGILNRGFVFTSKNNMHVFCPCGNFIINT